MSERVTAGGALLRRLKALGIDHVFCNSGTDFPPIIEGLAEAKATGVALPRMLTIPHEHAAVSMAHGYYQMTGRGQAVMLHTNVGLANGASGAINAATAHVPVLMMSGRTPVTEEGRFGARTVPIGWGQEMRDQTALVREASKWDYELRFSEQIAPLLDRADAIAHSTPRGPVYLSLPREVLCESVDAAGLDAPASIAPVRIAPDPAAVTAAARALAGARAPLIIAQRGAGDDESFAAFARMVEDRAIPVCSWWAVELALATDHPCHIGPDPSPWIEDADVIVILDALAPWWPDKHRPRADATVINIGPDPLFSRFPVRNFRCDVALAGESADTLPALAEALSRAPRDEPALAARRRHIAAASDAVRADMRKTAQAGNGAPMSKEYISHCLGVALEGTDSTVHSELGVMLGHLPRSACNSWFQEPHSGGLGWAFGAALGAQLAAPDRLIVATMGDGSYMFANPTVCHQIAESLELPVVVLVLNNREWGAVRHSVTGMYPDGHAARANEMPLTGLTPSPDFTLTAQASRAHAERVSDGAELPEALARAIRIARGQRRQVLLEIDTSRA